MLIRSSTAALTVAAALVAGLPAAKADFAIMTAHNYEILMRSVQDRPAQVSVHRVMQDLGRRGFRDMRVIASQPGVYRIHAHRGGQAYMVTAAARTGRILAIRRA